MIPSRYRKRFIASRLPLRDAEFLSQLGAEPQMRQLIVAARHAIARACDIPGDYVYPDDPPSSFARMFILGDADELALRLAFEAELDTMLPTELPRFFDRRFFSRKQPGARTVGEWSLSVGRCAAGSVPKNG